MMTLTHSFKQIYNIIIAQQVFLETPTLHRNEIPIKIKHYFLKAAVGKEKRKERSSVGPE